MDCQSCEPGLDWGDSVQLTVPPVCHRSQASVGEIVRSQRGHPDLQADVIGRERWEEGWVGTNDVCIAAVCFADDVNLDSGGHLGCRMWFQVLCLLFSE